MSSIPCPCGSNAIKVSGDRVYPHRSDLHHRRFYMCVECGRYVGCHFDGRPLGVPADAETREARMYAHAVFDPLWQGPDAVFEKRSAAYRWLARSLGKDEVHIGEMTADEARKVRELVLTRARRPDHCMREAQ
jgi:hypothetical protein